MTTEFPESSLTVPSTLIIQVQSETSIFNAGITLTKTNYDTWSQILEMHIAGCGKLDYIIGDSPQPSSTDATYSKWYSENQKVKSWILTSMSPEIMKRYLRLRTAREIWSALAKAFNDGTDEAQIFALNQRAFSLTQFGRPLPSYYGELVEIFQELDHRDKVQMIDPSDVVLYRASVRGEILCMDPGLDFECTYAYVRHEANRKNLLAGDQSSIEPVAMVVQRNKKSSCSSSTTSVSTRSPASVISSSRSASAPVSVTPSAQFSAPVSVALSAQFAPNTTSRSFDVKDRATVASNRHCTHCGGTGHIQSHCYDLIGYPD